MSNFAVNGVPIGNPQRSFFLSMDKADEEDWGVVNVWDKKEHTITYTLSAQGDNLFARWLAKARKEFQGKKKALRYAITHGYTIRLIFENDGTQSFIDITKPRELNIVFRFLAFLPRMRIIKGGTFHDIRKGRLRPMRVWPMCQEETRKYERLFQHNISNC